MYGTDALKSRTIFCFWTGDNPITPRRLHSLRTIQPITGCKIQYITQESLNNWILPYAPLHQAYPFLSAVHKADYLRAYFMCHYGGGYSDIKEPTGSWIPAFEALEQNTDLWVVGYPEGSPDDLAAVDDKELYRKMQSVYSQMVGNGSYVCRSGTPLVRRWLAEVHRILDRVYKQLEAYPAPHPRVMKQGDPNYALKWTEICGNVFHPLVYEYLAHVSTSLPKPICHGYQ
jgi:hypothetical protein